MRSNKEEVVRVNETAGRSIRQEESLPSERYLNDAYFSARQWIGYSGQINAIRSIRPKTMLEIGVGNGMVSVAAHHLFGIQVTGLDINPNLDPDVVGNVLTLDSHVDPDSYECVLCAQVLEHISFESFETCLVNIARATRRHAIITLPRTGNLFHAVFNVPKVKAFDILLQLPMSYVPPGHHWEIDSSRQSRLKAILRLMEKHFVVLDHHRIPQDPKIHLFLLEKKR